MTRPTPGILRTAAAPPTDDKVSIVVLNWNGRAFLERALRSIVEYTVDETYELVVIDNGSTDDSLAFLEDFTAPRATRLEVIRNRVNRYFSAAFNQGFNAAASDSRYLMVFCNDVEAKERGWLSDFIEAIQGTGAIAAGYSDIRPLDPVHAEVFRDSDPAYADPALAERMRAAVENRELRYAHLGGFCFLLDHAALRETGLYMEGGAFQQYHSDWELYLRFHVLGHSVATVAARVHHWHSISELIAEHPHRYAQLVEAIEDEDTARSYVRRGRPLFREESGFRSRARESQK